MASIAASKLMALKKADVAEMATARLERLEGRIERMLDRGHLTKASATRLANLVVAEQARRAHGPVRKVSVKAAAKKTTVKPAVKKAA